MRNYTYMIMTITTSNIEDTRLLFLDKIKSLAFLVKDVRLLLDRHYELLRMGLSSANIEWENLVVLA